MVDCLNCGKKHIQYSAFCSKDCAYIWGLLDNQKGKWTAIAHFRRN